MLYKHLQIRLSSIKNQLSFKTSQPNKEKMHYQPKCIHGRVAIDLCVTRGCQIQNCFCCSQCKRNHPKSCEIMNYKKFVYEVHKRQGIKKQEFCRYEERVENTFNTLIKALKKQFIEFREQFERFNATEEIVKFYDNIQGCRQNNTNGDQAGEILALSIPKMVDYRLKDEIQMKRLQNNIMAVNSYVIKKLRPYYSLREKFQQIETDFPEIPQLRKIEEKYMDRDKESKSGLLTGDTKYIESLIKQKVYSLQLLYRASQHNFSSRKFHEICDGKKNTLVVALTEYNKLIGLWCPFQWRSTQKWQYICDSQTEKAFMFSFQNDLKGIKFVPFKKQFAIAMHKDYGPIFGEDFIIYDKAHNSKSCWSNFPDVYNSEETPFEHDQKIIKAFVGTDDHFQKFNLIEWEVYKINRDRVEDLDQSWMLLYKNL